VKVRKTTGALQPGLAVSRNRPTPKRYRIRAVSLGTTSRGIDLDKALALAGSLEDEELAAKQKSGK